MLTIMNSQPPPADHKKQEVQMCCYFHSIYRGNIGRSCFFLNLKPPPIWRIIPVRKWLVTPIDKPFRPFGKGTTLLRGLTMVIDSFKGAVFTLFPRDFCGNSNHDFLTSTHQNHQVDRSRCRNHQSHRMNVWYKCNLLTFI